MAQIIERGKDTYLIRVFLGRDKNGKRLYANETFKGGKKEAKKKAQEIEGEVNRSAYVKRQKSSLEAYLDQWLEIVKPSLKENTYGRYAYDLKHYVCPRLGARILADITSADVQALYAGMLDAGLSPNLVRNVHKSLSIALKKAVRLGMLRSNPLVDVELPKKSHKEIQAFSPEEASAFIGAAKEDSHGVLLAFALATGMRPQEYIGLQWKDVDWTQGTVSIQRAVIRRKGGGWKFDEPKTPQSRRTIPLPPSTLAQLKDHKRRQMERRLKLGSAYQNYDLVFANEEGAPLCHVYLTRSHFKPTLEKAGLSMVFTLYSLRHSCATLLLSAGVNPKIVSERLGHSSVKITLDTYSHVLPQMQQTAAERLEVLLFPKFGTQ